MEDSLTPQEMKMHKILEPLQQLEDETRTSLLYEPVIIRIPIKNCQDTLSTKAILEEYKKQTRTKETKTNER